MASELQRKTFLEFLATTRVKKEMLHQKVEEIERTRSCLLFNLEIADMDMNDNQEQLQKLKEDMCTNIF